MLYIYPDYYKEFTCIADACPATCCAGWQIVIDEKSLKKYRELSGHFVGQPRRFGRIGQLLTSKRCKKIQKELYSSSKMTPGFGNRLLNSIDWKEGIFLQYDKRCAFLNEENLCDLYLEGGESYFCKTCKNYPRHIEEFEGIRELSLSVSCPEVARMLLSRKEPVRFLEMETKKEENYEEFDYLLFTQLSEIRTLLLSWLTDRTLSIHVRFAMVLSFCHDVQVRYQRQTMYELSKLVESYQNPKCREWFMNRGWKRKIERKPVKPFFKEMLELLLELEPLDESWQEMIKNILENEVEGEGWPESDRRGVVEKNRLNRNKNKTSGNICSAADEKDDDIFQRVLQVEHRKGKSVIVAELDVMLEQLAVYFVFTYFQGAVYDGKIYAKAGLAIVSTCFLEQLFLRIESDSKERAFEQMVRYTYQYAREIEHSDPNLNALDDAFMMMDAFKVENMVEEMFFQE